MILWWLSFNHSSFCCCFLSFYFTVMNLTCDDNLWRHMKSAMTCLWLGYLRVMWQGSLKVSYTWEWLDSLLSDDKISFSTGYMSVPLKVQYSCWHDICFSLLQQLTHTSLNERIEHYRANLSSALQWLWLTKTCWPMIGLWSKVFLSALWQSFCYTCGKLEQKCRLFFNMS